MTTVATSSAAPGAPATRPARRKRTSGGGGIGRYIVVRFLLIFPTIFILVSMVFWLMRTTGDPITAALGGRLTPEQLAVRIHAAGYDRPILVQYVEYLGQVFTGNFGTTLSDTNRPVTQVLLTYGGATLELAFYALIVAFIVGIPLGMVAAYLRDKAPDAFLRIFAILCYATPVFFAGLLLKLVFAGLAQGAPGRGPGIHGTELRSGVSCRTRPASTRSTRCSWGTRKSWVTCSRTRFSPGSRSAS